MDVNRSGEVQPKPHAAKRHHLVFWGMGSFVFMVVIWRMFTHPAAMQLWADVDSRWYLRMAERIAEGQFWDIQQQAPFMPLYSVLMVPAYWLGKPELGPMFAFSLVWIGFLIWLHRLVGPRWIVLVPFLSLPILNCYLLAWSEVLSLPLLVLFLVNLAKSSQTDLDELNDGRNKSNTTFAADKSTAILLVLLVLTRWANLYFIGALGLIWVINSARDHHLFRPKSIWRLLVLIGPSLVAILLVGQLNLHHTDHFFGYEKMGAVEVSASSAQDWIVALGQIMSWFHDPVAGSIGLRVGLWTVQALLFLWLIKQGELACRGVRSLLLIGLTLGYGFWIGITERITELDVVDYRLLAPCLLMIWMALVRLGSEKGPKAE